jgi:hypothetical protein
LSELRRDIIMFLKQQIEKIRKECIGTPLKLFSTVVTVLYLLGKLRSQKRLERSSWADQISWEYLTLFGDASGYHNSDPSFVPEGAPD